MVFRATKQAWLANESVPAFPMLLPGAPRGSSIFIAALLPAVLPGWRCMGQIMSRNRTLLVQLGLAILAVHRYRR